jgi:hypothetical protein
LAPKITTSLIAIMCAVAPQIIDDRSLKLVDRLPKLDKTEGPNLPCGCKAQRRRAM